MALVVAGFFLGQGVSGDGAEALRQGTFQVVSILTSTGFQTIPSFADLGPALLFLFGLLMLVGAEARSTSGGIKLYRVAVASLGLGHDLHERYGNKRHVTSIKINRFGKRSVLTEVDVAEAQTYVVLYLLLCAAGAFALILCGATLQEAVFDFVSCLGSTGRGHGLPRYGKRPRAAADRERRDASGPSRDHPPVHGGGHLGVDDSERSSP